jgi:hypothetical protein
MFIQSRMFSVHSGFIEVMNGLNARPRDRRHLIFMAGAENVSIVDVNAWNEMNRLYADKGNS